MKRVFSRFRSSGLLGLAAMLAVLLGVLAVLQYRWVGQLSQDERDRMRKHLHGRADDLADDFNRELTRIFVWLQVGPDLRREDPLAEEGRYEHWYTSAPHPELVRAIYQIDVDAEGQMTFRQYERAEQRLEPTAWPEALTPIREALTKGTSAPPLPEPGGLRRPNVARIPLLWPDIPAVVIPRSRFFRLMTGTPGAAPPTAQVITTNGYTVAFLNDTYLREQLLPSLVGRYFQDEGGRRQPHVAVSSKDKDIVYATAGAPATILKTADVVEPLWDIRFGEFNRFVIDRRHERHDDQPAGAAKEGGKEGAKAGAPAKGAGPGKEASSAPSGDRVTLSAVAPAGGGAGGREEAARGSRGASRDGRDGPGRQQAQINVFYARDERGRGGSGGGITGNLPVWKVHLLDKAGSLEAAVGRARWRNLLISFSVLVLLGSSMTLVLLSSARARRLAAQQMEFVAGVSHELRTPLTVIRSAAENLADGIVQDDPQVRKYGALIATEGRRLTQMVEQVMTFAGLQAGKPGLDIRPVDPGAVIDEALVAMAPIVREQDAVIETDVAPGLPAILADASAVSRCIQNLLGNALKYGGHPGRIRVVARGVTRGGVEEGRARQIEHVAITVEDDGPGISPRDLPHIFEPFYRGPDAVAAQIHGSGLGLSLVRRMMEELNGAVTVRSEPGRGSAFTLRLPVAREDAAHAMQPAGLKSPAPTGRL